MSDAPSAQYRLLFKLAQKEVTLWKGAAARAQGTIVLRMSSYQAKTVEARHRSLVRLNSGIDTLQLQRQTSSGWQTVTQSWKYR